MANIISVLSHTFKTATSTHLSRIALWLLLLSLCWCSVGMVLWNGARTVCYRYLKVHKQTVADTIYLSATMLTGTTAEVVWVERDEIRYRGKMFDIKQQIDKGNGVVALVGHYDSKEDKLFKILRRLVDAEEEQEGTQTPVWEFAAILPVPPAPSVANTYTALAPAYHYTHRVYTSLHISPPVPPPDWVCMIFHTI